MSPDKLWEHLMNLSIVCGMNQRYSQHMLSSAQTFSSIVDWFVLASTILCLVLVVASYFAPKRQFTLVPLRRDKDGWLWLGPPIDWLSMAASVLAAIAG